MPEEIGEDDVETLPLPKNWRSSVRSAVLHVIGIVRIAMLVGRESLIKNGDVHEARIVWCKARNILPRFGAVNKHGSIAVFERFHRTLKESLLLITVPEHPPTIGR